MRIDKEVAVKLRKMGKSYNEIKKELGVPISTLSDWFRDQKWSNSIATELSERVKIQSIIRLESLNKVRGENLIRVYKDVQNEASKEFEELKYHPLFVAGVVIYWGEGDKASKNNFRISNSDPLMVRLFLDFLRKVCRVDEGRIRANILVYPDIDSSEALKFWSQKIGLSKNQFTRPTIIVGRHKTRKIHYGICVLTYSSTFLKKKMMNWIELLSEDFIKF
ncbi:MAG TPA: hypothetical protein VJI33_03635 [Candidatus Paceibacterota bacterium]